MPLLGPKLQDIQREVVHGRGFVLIRGLPVTEFDRETVARMYYGIGRGSVMLFHRVHPGTY